MAGETINCVAYHRPDYLEIELPDGGTIRIARNDVLTVQEFCDYYLRHFGAWDRLGREVVYPPADRYGVPA